MSTHEDDQTRHIRDVISHIITQAMREGGGRPIIISLKVMIPGIAMSDDDLGALKDGTALALSGAHPAIEFQRVGDEVTLVTELRGSSPEDIKIAFSDQGVQITAKSEGGPPIVTEAEVPPPEMETVAIKFRHGVLEITYRERALAVETSE
jgi:HSP20 family molecular chaperone IbpA